MDDYYSGKTDLSLRYSYFYTKQNTQTITMHTQEKKTKGTIPDLPLIQTLKWSLENEIFKAKNFLQEDSTTRRCIQRADISNEAESWWRPKNEQQRRTT